MKVSAKAALVLFAAVGVVEARRGVRVEVDPKTGKRTKVISFGGRHVTNDETSTWVNSPPTYDYNVFSSTLRPELGEIQVITNVLTEDELLHYNSLNLKIDQKVYKRMGADAIISQDLANRINNLFDNDDDGTCTSTTTDSDETKVARRTPASQRGSSNIKTNVFEITSPIPLHADRYAIDDVYTKQHVGVISLEDSDTSYFVWSDEENDIHYKVPMKRNTMLVFRGNYTHGILTMPDDKVKYMGPFDFHTFEDIGGLTCNGCLLSCPSVDELFVVDDADDPNECAYNVELGCPDGWTGQLCFDCDENGFTFFNSGVGFSNPTTGGTCTVDYMTPINEESFEACCGEVTIKIKGKTSTLTSKSLSVKGGSKGSSKGGNIMENVCDLSTVGVLPP